MHSLSLMQSESAVHVLKDLACSLLTGDHVRMRAIISARGCSSATVREAFEALEEDPARGAPCTPDTLTTEIMCARAPAVARALSVLCAHLTTAMPADTVPVLYSDPLLAMTSAAPATLGALLGMAGVQPTSNWLTYFQRWVLPFPARYPEFTARFGAAIARAPSPQFYGQHWERFLERHAREPRPLTWSSDAILAVAATGLPLSAAAWVTLLRGAAARMQYYAPARAALIDRLAGHPTHAAFFSAHSAALLYEAAGDLREMRRMAAHARVRALRASGHTDAQNARYRDLLQPDTESDDEGERREAEAEEDRDPFYPGAEADAAYVFIRDLIVCADERGGVVMA